MLLALERGGRCRLSDLVASAGVAQPSMTELVTRLESASLVSRTRDPDDGRAVLVSLAPGGSELMARRRAAATDRIVALLGGLEPAEVDALVAALPAMAKLGQLAAGLDPGA